MTEQGWRPVPEKTIDWSWGTLGVTLKCPCGAMLSVDSDWDQPEPLRCNCGREYSCRPMVQMRESSHEPS